MGEPNRFYANWLRTVPGPLEFALDFGYIEPGIEAPPGGPREDVRVVMTWEYAKLLRDAMNQAIETREGNMGEIRELQGVVGEEVERGPRGDA
jgi:hypothetical protein